MSIVVLSFVAESIWWSYIVHTSRTEGSSWDTISGDLTRNDPSKLKPSGGPITLELSDSVFRGEESVGKVAQLVRAFAQLGCQQMQLNTVKLETLRAAQAHPEQYRDVIVRVWGWSAYFVDLAPEYQDHVMSRHMYSL